VTELAADGGRTELHLCRGCITRLGLSLDDPPPIAQLLSQNPTQTTTEDGTVAVPAPAPGHTACPLCGLEFTAYMQSNLFGCIECYQVFAPQVSELVKRYHGVLDHVGRLPTAGQSPVLVAQRAAARAALQVALTEAVAREQFERAAELRDQLKALETGPVAGGA
jgi:protein arginine kinase activator